MEQCGFNGRVEFHVAHGDLIIKKPKKKAREGWAEAAKFCHEAGDDKLIWPENMINEFDKTEWTWPTKNK